MGILLRPSHRGKEGRGISFFDDRRLSARRTNTKGRSLAFEALKGTNCRLQNGLCLSRKYVLAFFSWQAQTVLLLFRIIWLVANQPNDDHHQSAIPFMDMDLERLIEELNRPEMAGNKFFMPNRPYGVLLCCTDRRQRLMWLSNVFLPYMDTSRDGVEAQKLLIR